MSDKRIGTWHISSTQFRNSDDNAVIVRETKGYEREDGSRYYVPSLRIYEDPERPFWITQKQYRDHAYKKEFEHIEFCDEYHCPDSELAYAVGNALEVGWKRLPLSKLLESPYVYGADIEVEAIIKQQYLKKSPNFNPPYTKGGLDIETEMVGDKRINLTTFIHEHTIYSVGLKEFCKVYDDEAAGKWHWATMKEIRAEIMHWVGDLIEKYGFQLNLRIFDTEVQMMKWIFDRIHECKTDFIGVWNIHFDIPKILERLKAANVRPEMIMCHPDVPQKYQFVRYDEDMSKRADHFTDKWHWLNLPGYSQFIDAMCLYARLRKVYGRDSSYALDKIADKELGLRKLHFDGSDNVNHRIEQEYHFLRYWAYNINDVLLMQLMEFQNDDYGTLASLSDVSLLSEFHHMTTGLKHDAFVEGLAHGRVPASVGRDNMTRFDEMLPRIGGTVLPPHKAENVSVAANANIPDRKTLVSVLTNDLDVSAFYPSTTEEFNVSRETTLCTIIGINGHPQSAVEHLSSCLVQTDISAVAIATTYFGLPSYEEALGGFEEYLSLKAKSS